MRLIKIECVDCKCKCKECGVSAMYDEFEIIDRILYHFTSGLILMENS